LTGVQFSAGTVKVFFFSLRHRISASYPKGIGGSAWR